MSVRAVLKEGQIRPIDPLPPEWRDGQELVVDEPDLADPAELEQWIEELRRTGQLATASQPDELTKVLEELERESKERARRERGL